VRDKDFLDGIKSFFKHKKKDIDESRKRLDGNMKADQTTILEAYMKGKNIPEGAQVKDGDPLVHEKIRGLGRNHVRALNENMQKELQHEELRKYVQVIEGDRRKAGRK